MLAPKRSEILYSRVTLQNKKYVKKLAEKEDRSEAAIVDFIIDHFRKSHASNRKKLREGN